MTKPDVARLETRVDRLSARVDAHDESQRAISDTLVDLTDGFDHLTESVVVLTGRFDHLAESVVVLTGRVDHLTESVVGIQHTVAELQQTVGQHTATLDQHTGMLAEILRHVGGSAPGP